MLALEEAAQGFAAVGSEPRLDVLLSLVRAGPEGLSVGDIQERVDLPASTLAHHLRFLAAAGLIAQERQGRVVRSRAAFPRIEALAAFLLRECCADSATPHLVTEPHHHPEGCAQTEDQHLAERKSS